MTNTREPWDVRLSADRRQELAEWLVRELDNALSVRSASDAEIQYWHTIYEQGRTRDAASAPWTDAADLTSAIGTEKVDALRSRIMKTLFVDPIWTVEGWGESAKQAAFVEEFHQWQAETSGFQANCSRAIHLALIEPRGVLEVYEDTIRRPVRKSIKAAMQLAPDGTALVGDDFQPQPQMGDDGRFVEVTDPEQPFIDLVIDDFELVVHGPRERVIPYRDYLQLPAHAPDLASVWGHAKRFWRSVDQLTERVSAGIYDADAVEGLGSGDERAGGGWQGVGTQTLAGQGVEIPSQEDGLAEKELWEVTFLSELDRTGYRWFVATVHQPTSTILRLQYDEIGRPRYCCFVLFPRPYSTEGYSFIGHKLINAIEENTAWRNMLADRAVLQLKMPIKRLASALWDPEDEPIGAGAVITVRDMNEVQAFQYPDYTSPARERIIDTERQAEKLGGMTDIASGSRPNEDRTLGETRLVSSYSEVRIEEVIRNAQETLEDIAQIRHLMWQRALQAMPEGLPVSQRVLQGLETRGVNVAEYLPNKRAAASMLQGAFRFKPRGSVEQTDRGQQRADVAEFLKALGFLAQINPAIGILLQQPQPIKSLLEHLIRIYAIQDKQSWLGPETMQAVAQALQLKAQEQAMQQQMAASGGMAGGMPPQPSVPIRPPA